MPKFLDENGVGILYQLLNNEDYPNNETLIAVINAIDETKADKNEIPTMDEIYNEIVNRLPIAEDGAY